MKDSFFLKKKNKLLKLTRIHTKELSLLIHKASFEKKNGTGFN